MAPRKQLKMRPSDGIQAANPGLLDKADPELLKALMAEIEDELKFRDGTITEQVEPPEPHALTHEEWPHRDYVMVQRWRHRMMEKFNKDPSMVHTMYGADPIRFICHWLDIYEPRNAGLKLPTKFPFILFKRQEDLLNFYHACVVEEGNGLVEKSRDMGATWCGVAYSIWLWLFVPGTAVGWGSATADKLDRLGDANSIFEKIRMTVRGLPKIFLPKKFKDNIHLSFKRVVNPENGSTITGDIGDNIGRGGRTRVYFVDEAAYLEHPDAVEGALSENTRVRIDISSVSGPGTVFHRTRQAGTEWTPGAPIVKDRHNVFLLDWRDHPEKSEAWAAAKKKSFEERGLGHVYAREIGRDYAAVTEGAVIKPEWVLAAFNAHKKLNLPEMAYGKRYAGLDIADGGEAANACTIRENRTVKAVRMWTARDPAATTRDCIDMCTPFLDGEGLELNYDCIGMGSSVRSEANNLNDKGVLPGGLTLIPWAAGASVLNPFEPVIPQDPKSPTNKAFYQNLKAQAWWYIRQIFYDTYRMVQGEMTFTIERLISIDTDGLPVTLQHKLRDELCQVQSMKSPNELKLMIKKADHPRQSPNVADSLVMAFFPVPIEAPLNMWGAVVAPMVIRV